MAGMFGRGNEEEFYPNCRVGEGSSEGRLVLDCQPKLVKDGKALTGDRMTKVIVENGQKAVVVDDGGNPESVLDRLLSSIENKRLSQ